MKIKLIIEDVVIAGVVLINRGVSDSSAKPFVWSAIDRRLIET